MARYRIIRHGKNGFFETQILVRGWFWNYWAGFEDPLVFGLTKLFKTKKEALQFIKNQQYLESEQFKEDSKEIIVYESNT